MAEGWVCPECGLDYETISGPDMPVAIRSYPRRFKALLTSFDDDEDAGALVRRKPAPETWSALVYAGHVGDVFEGIGASIRRMLDEDRPTVTLDDPDAPGKEEQLGGRTVDQTMAELADRAGLLAGILDGVKGDAWSRTGQFPWGARDVLTMARNAVHEGHHHLRDVEGVLATVRGR